MTETAKVIDGGNRGCGELLLQLRSEARHLPGGSVLRLIATDPAAPDDLPRWCAMTGHSFLSASLAPDGRPAFDIGVRANNDTRSTA
ncbi:MAG: sulfurtransferase TusA family protein [Candidatus Dormibacteraeota bacterium]|uniref:Sulfurtransferase TusA family protein n=1 Tax=Candidatus Amunia macphersoniae TaxID=3127014 RepID=A0A934NJ99_9BACT|nr:sulfurtransferase TusA family protein [Candidatus Dormibacteraeota bacterium]